MARNGQTLDELMAALGYDRTSPRALAHSEDFSQFEDFGDSMVVARRKAGLTQTDVAKIMGTTQSAVSEIESIGCNPTVETLRKYVRALGYRLIISAEKVEASEPHATTSNA